MPNLKKPFSTYFITCLFTLLALAGQAQQRTIIQGIVPANLNDKEASLIVYKYVDIIDEITLKASVTKGTFKFVYNLKEPGYVNLALQGNRFSFFVTEPGDSVTVNVETSGDLTFSGKGSEKFTYQYLAGKKKMPTSSATISPDVNNPYFKYLDSCRDVKVAYLESFKTQLSKTAFHILKADIVFENEASKARRIYINIMPYRKQNPYEKLHYEYLMQRKELIINDTTAYAHQLIKYMQMVNENDYLLLYNTNGGAFNFEGKYALAKAFSGGKVQERYLAARLILQISYGVDAAISSKNDYLNGPYRDDFKKVIREKYTYQENFAAGKLAIPFSLPNVDGKPVSLASLKGKVVLLDFWYNGCVGCVESFNAMPVIKQHFKDNKDVVFVNVSVDGSKSRWLNGIDLYKIKDDINLYTNGKAEEHPIIKSYAVVGFPTLFLIDKKGKFAVTEPPRPSMDAGVPLIKTIEEALKK